ncbi:MAG: chitobiase/beta-hexosaminidase C-terminal domain-containing protein [Prevotella sp.]|nr:chitobiase/beta-hexosaminidase C-terminal domain-containing protein [Candidatus Prevotella equi]
MNINKTNLLTFLLSVVCLFFTSSVYADDLEKHTLAVVSKPTMAGSFNTNSASLSTGETIHLYAYANKNFSFKEWTDADGIKISSAQDFIYTMPPKDVTLTAVYEYNPANPANPAKNYWNSLTGEVIIDDFTAGSLSGAVSTALNGGKSSDVLMITVAGRITSNDFNITNNYSNCSLLDLSRVTGVTEVPSYAFDYTKLESVYLPASIEKIGYHAFYQCQQLSSVTVYAMTPPMLESNVFTGVQEGLVIYVPAAAITQYQDAAGWKEFTILPIQEDIRSLSISFPNGTDVTDYSQMWLELTNTKSGQKMHYVMTDRSSYTFSNIIRNTSWNAVLRNQRGDVFGKIENIEVKDEDVSVVFSSLSKPQNVSLTVKTPNGETITSNTQITWLDSDGNYLAQSTGLSGLLSGYAVSYRVVLSQDLAMQYVAPEQKDYIVSDANNNLTLTLEPIKQLTISGCVKDLASRTVLSGATVTASQTFGGKYSKTVSTKTDAKGNYVLTVSNVPTSLAVSASDYISQTIVCDSLMTGVDAVSISEVSLKSISGAVVSLNLTYTKCPSDNGEETFQEWYSDYNNVAYSIYNKTKQKSINQFNVQYPQIVLLEEVDEGDVLEMTAKSKVNAFIPVKTTATIDAEQRADAAFYIIELGKIKSVFAKNNNASVVGSLYDSNGKLLKSYDYSNASLTINNLADGSYTLVTMGASKLFNSIYDLSQLPQTGLVLSSDYTQTTVDVQSGKVCAIDIAEVPTLDESKLYYTGDNTSFTVNKSSIVAGNYLTLTGHLDFKSAYATKVSNVNLIIDLPESCEFVENSVMVGNSTSSYTIHNNRITIPMPRYTDRVRFCIIPTLGGEYAPSAFAQFDIDGETITQPIGSANYIAKDLSISVPPYVAKTTIPVSGTAIGASAIEIYDGDVLIGQTFSLSNGSWSTTCELNEPYNLSTHNIYAKILTKAGVELKSENISCLYDKNAIEVSTVTMINTAHTSANLELYDYVTVFDFKNPSKEVSPYWYWPSYPEFTFLVDFTNNDPSVIDNVWLHVYTSSGDIQSIKPEYNAIKDRYVCKHSFHSTALPINVSVSFNANTEIYLDRSKINDIYKKTKEFVENSKHLEIDTRLDDLLVAINDENDDKADKILSEIYSILDINDIADDSDSISMDSLFLVIDNIILENKDLLSFKDTNEEMVYYDSTTNSYKLMKSGKVSEIDHKIETTTLREYSINDRSKIYFSYSDEGIILIDSLADYYVIVERIDANAMLAKRIISMPEWLEQLTEFIDQLHTWSDIIGEIKGDISEQIARLLAKNNSQMAKTMKELDVCRRQMALIKSKLPANAKLPKHYFKYQGKEAQLLGNLSKIKIAVQVLGGISRGISALNLINDVSYAIESINEWINIIHNIENVDCPGMDELKQKAISSALLVSEGYAATITADIACLSGIKASLTNGWILAAELAIGDFAIIQGNANKFIDLKLKSNILSQIPTLKNCKLPPPIAPKSTTNPTKYVLDPSGFVYEGVSSNRLEGVTATAYYKEMVEDMYGDLHENILKWDAEEYAQVNPLFTDENGMYAWDVPQGMWQVKFEKEGYETTYSEWLPVPPPQLDVNIAMTQNVQPNVKNARAYEDAVEIEFDKYMMPELLNTDNIIVMVSGKQVEGTVELLNEEAKHEGESETFASKLRFNTNAPFEGAEVTLVVNNRVKSYAGIRMQDNYSQSFIIEQEIRKIVCDSATLVRYGDNGIIPITVLPAYASAGKTINVRSSSQMILDVNATSAVLDENGKAEIPFSGELPGTAALTFTIDGYDLSATTIVNVEQIEKVEIEAPKANIASGTTVTKGTAITLSCATEGATIYYTLGGSCPCDEATRLTYTEPVIINETVTIKAIAVATDMTESDIVEFTYIVDNVDGIDEVTLDAELKIYPLPVRDKLNVTAGGKIIKSVTLTSMNGSTVVNASKPVTMVTLDVSSLTPGIYIINVTTEDKTYSRKIMKVE